MQKTFCDVCEKECTNSKYQLTVKKDDSIGGGILNLATGLLKSDSHDLCKDCKQLLIESIAKQVRERFKIYDK